MEIKSSILTSYCESDLQTLFPNSDSSKVPYLCISMIEFSRQPLNLPEPHINVPKYPIKMEKPNTLSNYNYNQKY